MTRPASGAAPPHEELLLAPYPAVLARLADKNVFIEIIPPPYPCIGRGRLHVVRAKQDADALCLALSYDDYERIE